MAEMTHIIQQQRDAASSFTESLTQAELGELLELKRTKRKSRTADPSAYWRASQAENRFIKDMTTKHGRELPGISVLFLTIPVVKLELARKTRNDRIGSVLGTTPTTS
jgi:hypothetical protein